MVFVYLEEAFERVPRVVIWWALGVDEWIVLVILKNNV